MADLPDLPHPGDRVLVRSVVAPDLEGWAVGLVGDVEYVELDTGRVGVGFGERSAMVNGWERVAP